jgi:hypothetical protein
MNKESAYISPTFGNYKAVITKSVDERVKQINDFTLEYFAKKSTTKREEKRKAIYLQSKLENQM